MKKLLIILSIWFLLYNIKQAQSLFLKMNGEIISPNTVIAEVDTIKITAEEFFYNYEYGPAFTKKTSNSKRKHLKYLINEKLLALESSSLNLLEKDETASIIEEINSDIASTEMYKDNIVANVNIDSTIVDSIMTSKVIELELRWLFSPDQEKIAEYWNTLKNGSLFDSLYNLQLNDSVFKDMRSMKATFYSLKKNNPILAEIVDTMKVGSLTAPIHVNNEWYIVCLDNIWKNALINENLKNKLYNESTQAAIKSAMDKRSNLYVDSLMRTENFVIKKYPFSLLRSYLGKFLLPEGKYNEWKLEEKLVTALDSMYLKKGDKYAGIDLVKGDNHNYQIDEFIEWYNNRSQYIKFEEDNYNSFSASLEGMVWRMVRDKEISLKAKEKGYFEDERVKKQIEWWRQKIAYSAMRKNLTETLLIENKEIKHSSEDESNENKLTTELMAKMYRIIKAAENKYKVKINNEALQLINVTEEESPGTIELYLTLTGGLIPHTPYPTIDMDWINWE